MFDIDINKLFENLKGSTPVYFSYLKKDGTRRNALGTLNPKCIPDEFRLDTSINEDKHFNGTNLKYFDLEKNGWRSLSYDVSTVTILE